MLSVLLSLTLLGACQQAKQSSSGLSPVHAASTTQKQPVPSVSAKETVQPVKQPKRDTLVVMDTLEDGKILRKKIYMGTVIKTDILANTSLKKNKPEKRLKDSYNVAILLPFLTQEYTEEGERAVPKRSKIILEFYEGMKMAFDILDKKGIHLNIDVMDSGGDTATVAKLFETDAVKKADLIIGLSTSDEIKLAATLAKKMDKVYVSPVNPKEGMVSNNDHFIQLRPSLKTQIDHALHYMKKQYGSKAKYMAIARDVKGDKDLLSQLQETYKAAGNDKPMPEFIVTDGKFKSDDFKSYLSESDSNIIFLTSQQDEMFVINVLNSLSYLDETVIVVGMPKWYEYQKITSDLLKRIGVFVPNDYYADSESPEVNDFRKNYISIYGGNNPSEHVYRGYESMLYVGNMLQKHGINFRYNNDPVSQMSSLINLVEVKDLKQGTKSSAPLFFENRAAYLLRFVGNRYIKVY